MKKTTLLLMAIGLSATMGFAQGKRIVCDETCRIEYQKTETSAQPAPVPGYAVVSPVGRTSVLKENRDTSVFNPSSIMLHDGASLDALLMEIPGLNIDARGGVSINGRPVRELLIEGHRYFGTDVATGLRNIPAHFVGSVQAYEKDSDVGLVSGIDQADKEMVIDISVKQNLESCQKNRMFAYPI